jgi:hypothetical protein
MHDFLHERPAVQPSHCRDFQRRLEDDPVYEAMDEGVEVPEEADANNVDGAYDDVEENNAESDDERQRPQQSSCNAPEQGMGVPASVDFFNISDRPQLQRRLHSGTGTAPANAAMPGTQSAPIEVTSSSTGKKRKTTNTAGLVEATASGTKALVQSIDKIRDSNLALEDKQSKDLATVTEKQLEYFRYRDWKIHKTQRRLVQAISSLSQMIGRSFAAQQATSRGAHLRPDDIQDDNYAPPSNIPEPTRVGTDTADGSAPTPQEDEEEGILGAANTLLTFDSSHSGGTESDGASSN